LVNSSKTPDFPSTLQARGLSPFFPSRPWPGNFRLVLFPTGSFFFLTFHSPPLVSHFIIFPILATGLPFFFQAPLPPHSLPQVRHSPLTSCQIQHLFSPQFKRLFLLPYYPPIDFPPLLTLAVHLGTLLPPSFPQPFTWIPCYLCSGTFGNYLPNTIDPFLPPPRFPKILGVSISHHLTNCPRYLKPMFCDAFRFFHPGLFLFIEPPHLPPLPSLMHTGVSPFLFPPLKKFGMTYLFFLISLSKHPVLFPPTVVCHSRLPPFLTTCVQWLTHNSSASCVTVTLDLHPPPTTILPVLFSCAIGHITKVFGRLPFSPLP